MRQGIPQLATNSRPTGGQLAPSGGRVLTCVPEFVVSMDAEEELNFKVTNINGAVPQAHYQAGE